jgi:hypothetical protein
MPIQRVILECTERIEVITTETRANIEASIDAPISGNLGNARPIPVTREITPWRAVSSTLGFEREPTEQRAKPPARRARPKSRRR